MLDCLDAIYMKRPRFERCMVRDGAARLRLHETRHQDLAVLLQLARACARRHAGFELKTRVLAVFEVAEVAGARFLVGRLMIHDRRLATGETNEELEWFSLAKDSCIDRYKTAFQETPPLETERDRRMQR